jgi:hypothetical protein
MLKGAVPLREPKSVTLAGATAEVQPWADFKTGRVKNESIFFGSEPTKYTLPSKVEEAWLAASLGDDDAFDKLEGGYKTFASQLLEGFEFKTADDIQAEVTRLNRAFQPLAPGFRMFIPYDVDEKTGAITMERTPSRGFFNKIFSGDDPVYSTEGFPWIILPVEGTITLGDGENTGTFYLSRTKDGESIAVGEDGKPMPVTKGVSDNEVVPELTIPAPPPPPQEGLVKRLRAKDVERARRTKETIARTGKTPAQIATEQSQEVIFAGIDIATTATIEAITTTLTYFGQTRERARRTAKAFKQWQTDNDGGWNDFIEAGMPGSSKPTK